MTNFTHEATQFSIKTCRPMEGGVLVKLDKLKDQTEGGIYIPEIAQDKASTGVVIKVGLPVVNEFGVSTPIPLEEKDKVIFSKFSGQEITFKEDEDTYKIINIKVIFGVIEE